MRTLKSYQRRLFAVSDFVVQVSDHSDYGVICLYFLLYFFSLLSQFISFFLFHLPLPTPFFTPAPSTYKPGYLVRKQALSWLTDNWPFPAQNFICVLLLLKGKLYKHFFPPYFMAAVVHIWTTCDKINRDFICSYLDLIKMYPKMESTVR